MVQTRAEAAALVVELQRDALAQGVVYGAIAAVMTLSSMTAVIVLIAVAAPESWRGWALGAVVLLLLGAAVITATAARRRVGRDTALIADFSRGLKLDFAMVNLALNDPDTENEEQAGKREVAKAAVREAAAAKAATPSTAEGGAAPAADGPTMAAAAAAMRAAPADPAARPDPVVQTASATNGEVPPMIPAAEVTGPERRHGIA